MNSTVTTQSGSAIWVVTGCLMAISLGLLPGAAKLLGLVPLAAGAGFMLLRRPAIALLPAIIFCPFNFESLIARIGIPFVNPFNLAWLTAAVAVVILFRRQHRFSWPRTPLDRFLVLNITVTTIAVIRAWQIVPPDAFKDHFLVYQQWLQWLVFFWITVTLIRSRNDARIVVGAVAFMVLVAAVFGIKDYIAVRSVSGGAIERSQGLFGQANYAGSFFAFYLPPLIALVRVKQNKLLKAGLLMAALAGTVACILTFSRGSMMALGIAVIIVIIQTRSRSLCILAALALVIIASDPTVKARFSETTRNNGDESVELDDSSGARLIAWEKAIDLALKKPLFGYGFYSFRHIHHPLDAESAAKFGHGSMDVHNGHLNTLVSAGLVGSCALYLQFGAVIVWCLRLKRTLNDPFGQALAMGLVASVAAILVVNLTGTRLYDRQLMAFIWILAGALHGMARIENEIPCEQASSIVSH